MTIDNPLAAHVVAPGAGAGFEATMGRGLARVRPLTPRAEAWLRTNASSEATWLSDQLVVELRYFPQLADAIIAAGFSFERNAYLN